ncbi:Nitrogenase molybdenum-iron protein alpha chain [Sulfurospirillum diekertiae]|uniref:Nitrogenase molybdenum-iron protein alpha chain n=1 Tax=Sulfurospirillum diekertiae TaxID=1854492 RepID=A0A290HE84_9BACT|nr:nitrogenase component 1 [Sulfurospirillum diekertiae]ATB69725.1 Nitrogenase molybdenum-iron protein alpha chain [Sulfurospirillum diekertiae]
MSRFFSIKELYNESSCSHSGDKEKKNICERLHPGSSISDCALEGAFKFLSSYEDCAHLIYSSSTCFTTTSIEKSSHPKHSNYFCSNLDLNDIIFGGASKLKLQLDHIVTLCQPKVVFIYITCVTSLIGEDIDVIAQQKQHELGVIMVPILAAGFLGASNFGARIASMTLCEHLIGLEELAKETAYDVNLLSCDASSEEMKTYCALIESIGLRVISTFGSGKSIEPILSAHKAKLNIVISAKPLATMARKMEEICDIPWVQVSFFGKYATSDALRTIAEVFNDGKLSRHTQNVIACEEKKLAEQLEIFKESLYGKKVLINLQGMLSWAYIPLLRDLDMHVVATSIENITEDDKEQAIRLLFGKGMFMYEPENEQMDMIKEEKIDLLITNSENVYAAVQTKIPFLNIEREKEKHYVGYRGILEFAHILENTLKNPLFKIVYREAPWLE